MPSNLTVIALSPALGAEICGVDIAAGVSDDDVALMVRAHAEYGVIVIRGQTLTPAQHLEFARRFGAINVNRFFTPVAGHPEVAEVRKEPDHRSNIGGSWHTDHSYDVAPAMGSLLHALEVPRNGGDTLFASMYRAFDALSDGLKRTLRGLDAVHSSRHVFGPGRHAGDDGVNGRLANPELATQDTVHPVVIRHPVSGREALYVNPQFTLRFDGWTEGESRALLGYLYEHAVQDGYTFRLRWEAGSLAFWDNRCTWHRALNDYQGERRRMHRVTVEGVRVGR